MILINLLLKNNEFLSNLKRTFAKFKKKAKFDGNNFQTIWSTIT